MAECRSSTAATTPSRLRTIRYVTLFAPQLCALLSFFLLMSTLRETPQHQPSIRVPRLQTLPWVSPAPRSAPFSALQTRTSPTYIISQLPRLVSVIYTLDIYDAPHSSYRNITVVSGVFPALPCPSLPLFSLTCLPDSLISARSLSVIP